MKVDYSNIGFVRRNFTPVKNKLLNKNSQTESKFEKMLIDANIYFTREKCNYRIGSRWCYYDFFVPYWRLYFELDDNQHNNEEQKEIDTEKDCIVRNKQRFICRISNDYVLNEMTEINFEIAKDPSLGNGFCIGHSYFCGQEECSDEWMQSVVEYDILPMLSEYWFDEPTKVRDWSATLRSAIK